MFYVVKNTDNGLYFRGFDENMKPAWAEKMLSSYITESQKTEVMQSLGNYFHIEMIPVIINEKPLVEEEETHSFNIKGDTIKFTWKDGKVFNEGDIKFFDDFIASNGWVVYYTPYNRIISNLHHIGLHHTSSPDHCNYKNFQAAMQAMKEFEDSFQKKAEPKNYKQIIITIINSEEEIYQFTTRDFDVKFVYRDGESSHVCLKKPTAKREFTASNGWEIFIDESLYQGGISREDKEIYIGIKNTHDKISHNEFKEAMQAITEFVNQY